MTKEKNARSSRRLGGKDSAPVRSRGSLELADEAVQTPSGALSPDQTGDLILRLREQRDALDRRIAELEKNAMTNTPASTPESALMKVIGERRFPDEVSESAYGSIWSVDGRYCLVSANALFRREYRESFGKEAFLGESVLVPILSEAARSEWKGYYDRALGGETFSIERKRQYCTKATWSEYHFGPVSSPGGAISGVAVIAHNITERKNTEEALRQSEEKFRTLSASAPVGIYLTDSRGACIYVNRRWQEIYGLSLEESLGDDWSRSIHPGDRDSVTSEWSRIAQAGTGFEMEFRISPPNSPIRYVHSCAQPLLTDSSNRFGYVGTVEDITSRIIALDNLKKHDANMLAILESTSDLICSRDREHRLVFFNTPFARIVEKIAQIRAEPGLITLDYLPPEARAHWLPIVERTLRGEHYREEFPWTFNNGETRFYEISFSPIREGGDVIGYIEINRDVTDRKLADEQIKNVLRDKETLLRELHHRAKNNMMLICSMISLQMNDCSCSETKTILMDLKNRILSMSLVHQKLYQSQNHSEINMDIYIPELAELLIQNFHIHPEFITLDLALEHISLPLDIAIPFGMVLNELLANIFKHAFPDGQRGVIHIRLTRGETGEIELTVGDNGVGIPDHLDIRNQPSLGVKTICAIVEHQLRGNIRFENKKGLSCFIRFTPGH